MKDPQIGEFKRPGRTETKQRDSKRVISLYQTIAQSGVCKTDAYNIIAAKFSEKRRQRDIQKTEDFKKDYEARRAAIEEKKRQYQQKPAQTAVQKKLMEQAGR